MEYIVTANLEPNQKIEIILHHYKMQKYKIFDDSGTDDSLSDFTIGSYTFTMYNNHPQFNKLQEMKTTIKVFDVKANKYVFDGRVYKKSENTEESGTTSITYVCTTVTDFLNDSTQSYLKVQNTTPKKLLKMIIDCHNSQVEDYKKFYLGNVTMTNSTDNVYRYIDDTATTYETIRDKLLRDTLGGEMLVYRDKDDRLMIDWHETIAKKTNKTVILGKNMLSFLHDMDATEIVTRAVARGARIEVDEDENNETNSDASQPRYTIKNVNNDCEWIDADKQLIDIFGIHSKPIVFDDVTNEQTLYNKTVDFLKNQVIENSTFSITAVNLSKSNLNIEDFEKGDIFTVSNSLLEFNKELKVDYNEFSVNDIMIKKLNTSDTTLNMYQYWANMDKATTNLNNVQQQIYSQSNAINKISSDVEKTTSTVNEIQNNVVIGNSSIEEINKKITSLEKRCTKNEDDIKMLTTDFEDYKTKTDKEIADLKK